MLPQLQIDLFTLPFRKLTYPTPLNAKDIILVAVVRSATECDVYPDHSLVRAIDAVFRPLPHSSYMLTVHDY